LLLKTICPFGQGNALAQALWLIWITERLGTSRIAEIAKGKANIVETRENIIPLIFLLTIFVATMFPHKKGLFAAVVFTFKLTHPTHVTCPNVR
jgi:hypothetical protein